MKTKIDVSKLNGSKITESLEKLASHMGKDPLCDAARRALSDAGLVRQLKKLNKYRAEWVEREDRIEVVFYLVDSSIPVRIEFRADRIDLRKRSSFSEFIESLAMPMMYLMMALKELTINWPGNRSIKM